jgi:hypothetical protein
MAQPNQFTRRQDRLVTEEEALGLSDRYEIPLNQARLLTFSDASDFVKRMEGTLLGESAKSTFQSRRDASAFDFRQRTANLVSPMKKRELELEEKKIRGNQWDRILRAPSDIQLFWFPFLTTALIIFLLLGPGSLVVITIFQSLGTVGLIAFIILVVWIFAGGKRR